MTDKKIVTVKILKWETLQVLAEDEKSVKAFKEKLKLHQDETLDNQHKLMYSGYTLGGDKGSFFLRPQPITVLMATDKEKPENRGSLVYVEWPKKRRNVKELSAIKKEALEKEKKPPLAESEKEKEPPKAESEKEKEPPQAESEKEKEPPQAESEKEKGPPLADPEKKKEPQVEFEEERESPETKLEPEKLSQKLGVEKVLPKVGMEKAPPKAVVIGNPTPKTTGCGDKPKVQNAFDFIGEFVGRGSGEELFCIQKEGKDPTALSEDLLVKAMKKRLIPITNLIEKITHIATFRSML